MPRALPPLIVVLLWAAGAVGEEVDMNFLLRGEARGPAGMPSSRSRAVTLRPARPAPAPALPASQGNVLRQHDRGVHSATFLSPASPGPSASNRAPESFLDEPRGSSLVVRSGVASASAETPASASMRDPFDDRPPLPQQAELPAPTPPQPVVMPEPQAREITPTAADPKRLLAPRAAKPNRTSAPSASTLVDLDWLPTASGSPGAMVASVVVVAGLMVLAMALLKRSLPRSARPLPEDVVMSLGRTPLAGKQTAQLLKIGGKLVLVCVTPDGAKPLTEISDPEEVARLVGLIEQASPNSATAAFREVFDRIAREPAAPGFLGAEAPTFGPAPTIDRQGIAAAYANTPGGRAHAG